MKTNLFIIGSFFLINTLAADEPITCLNCDSKDANCITLADLSKIEKLPCESNKCFSQKDENGLVTRGCFGQDKKCEGTNCFECLTSNCNAHRVCQKCNSSTDPDCAQLGSDKPAFIHICPAADTQCFINIKDKHTERGCATAEQPANCNDNKDTCKLCNTGNCNTEVFPKRPVCYKCTGSACNDVNDSTDAKPCLLFEPQLKCYTIGSSATDMQRGCSSDDGATTKCKADDINCLTCNTDKCNNRKYSRIQEVKCEQCNSKDTPTCVDEQKTEIAQLQNCKNELKYFEEDQCYAQSKDNIAYRGCFYDRGDIGECQENINCKTCTANGCNNAAIKIEPAGFTCIRCRSNHVHECWNNADKLGGEKCQSGDGATDGCFSGVWNGVAIRGCMIDADPQTKAICLDKNNKQCTHCDKSNCNTLRSAGTTTYLMNSLLLIVAAVVFRLV